METSNVPLNAEHLRPYESGYNVFRHTHSYEDQADVYLGVIANIQLSESSLIIKARWIVRIREDSPLELDSSHVIENSFCQNYRLSFQDPVVLRDRSPLTIQCENDKIEISHVTNLARSVQILEANLKGQSR